MIALMIACVGLSLADEQFAPEVLRMDVTPVQINTVVHEDVDGGDVLRVFGANFGADAELNLFFGPDVEHLTKCSELIRETPSALTCKSLPRGAGKMLVVLERLDAHGELEARHRAWWSYIAPVVTSVAGGSDGLPLIVGGAHFGPDDGSQLVEVFVGPYAAHSASAPCVVSAHGTEVKCAGLPPGFGSQLHVTVCVAGVCGTSARPLVDYPAPVVEFSRVVDGRLHLYGANFGPTVHAAKRNVPDAPAVALEIDGQLCANAEVVVPGREIACDASTVPDATRSIVSLHRHGARMAATILKRQVQPTITGFSPTRGPTTGDFEFTITGSNLDLVTNPVSVAISDRAARGCAVSSDGSSVTCRTAPAGYGVDLPVTVSGATVANDLPTFSYDAPVIKSITRADTRGGKVFVHGDNFGPSFAPVAVQVTIGGETRDCDVERSTHTRIQCDAPSGTGEHHAAVVTVGGQLSTMARVFGYKRPEIHATTRPHWAGGHLYIRGANFGRLASDIEVRIGHEECRHVEVSHAHDEIRCRARPGAADGHEHTVRVRVNGQSSDKEGHSFHHMQYGNHAPQFAPHATNYVAVAGERLVIRLPAWDRDGDEIYLRARALPDGATWHRGFDFLQIEYNVPADLLAWPVVELNVTAEALVTDGPDTTVSLLTITARACPSTLDTCKDLSCVPRDTPCPQCPLSQVVQCSAGRPVLDTASGQCVTNADLGLSWARVAAAPVAPAGFTVDVAANSVQRALLYTPDHAVTGAIDVVPPQAATLRGAAPQPSTLICAEVQPCDADAAAGAAAQRSHAVRVALSTSTGSARVALGLPLQPSAGGASIGNNADGYGSCLGKFDATRGAWWCVDEQLAVRDLLLSGFIDGDGCYAIVADNCPTLRNPDQLDSDGDGVGDWCSGGTTLCESCHDLTGLNVKYLQTYAPTASDIEHDTCASNQSPYVIVSTTDSSSQQ